MDEYPDINTTHEQRVKALRVLIDSDLFSDYKVELRDLFTIIEGMQELDEIQRLHDTLHFVVVDLPKEQRQHIFDNEESFNRCQASMEALCYVLRHPAGFTFEKNVMDVDRLITTKLGLKLRKKPSADGLGID